MLIIIIGLFVAYVFRASLIQSAGPLIANRLGVEIAELDIAALNTREIAVPRFKARYFSQGKIIDVAVDRLLVQIDPWAGPRDAVKSVSVGNIELAMNATNDTSTADSSNVPVIELIRGLPSAAFIADHIALTYQSSPDDVLFYAGSAVRNQDTFAIRGKFVDPGNVSAEVDLNIKQNSYFDLNIVPTGSNDNKLHFKGELEIEDDWLLLGGHGGLKVTTVNNYLNSLDIMLPVAVDSIDSQFELKLEADLGLTMSDIVQSVAAKFSLDATSQLSASDYSVDSANLDLRVECIVAASSTADCLFRQPMNARLEFSTTPQWVRENFSWHEKKYSLELIPSDELALQVELGEVPHFKGHGSMRMNARADAAPLTVSTLLTDVVFNGSSKAWNLDSAFDVEFKASNLTVPSLDISRAIVDMQGSLNATDKFLQAQVLKGTKIIAQEMSSPELAADKIELTQQNNALVRFEYSSGQLDGGDMHYSLRPMQLQSQWGSAKVDSSQLHIQQVRYANDQWQGQANVNAGKVDVEQPDVSVTIYDAVSDLKLERDQLFVEGNAGIGQLRSALQFEGQHDLNGEDGNATIAINSFPLAHNDVVKKVIATTGLPLQFKQGTLAMGIVAQWGPLSPGESAAQVTLGIENVAGDYAQNQFEGLNTLVKLNESGGWYLAQPLAVTIDSINVGVPVTDISFGFDRVEKADDRQPVVKLSELSAQVLDGSIYAKNIEVDLNQPVNEFSIYLSNLSLEKLLALNQTEDLVASGSFDGELPIRIESENFSVHAGWLKADENGGVLKYNRIEEVLVGNPNLELVADLLKDFRYNEMSALVDLQPDGSVILATKLHGRSPNSEFDKQVNLNFNIEFNLWKFLESARLLTRIDQDVSQQIISKQRDK